MLVYMYNPCTSYFGIIHVYVYIFGSQQNFSIYLPKHYFEYYQFTTQIIFGCCKNKTHTSFVDVCKTRDLFLKLADDSSLTCLRVNDALKWPVK